RSASTAEATPDVGARFRQKAARTRRRRTAARGQPSFALTNVGLRSYVSWINDELAEEIDVAPFNVVLEDVPDEGLAPLLHQLAQAGFSRPIVVPASPATAAARDEDVAAMTPLLTEWRLLGERAGMSY